MSLIENLIRINEKIEAARLRSGRPCGNNLGVSKDNEYDPPTEIIAITKMFPAETIVDAYHAGLKKIGENRIQEAVTKFQALPPLPGINKRMVGHLQSNKAKVALDTFDAIDSIDSVKLGKKVSKLAIAKGVQFSVQIQVNTSGDPAKFGFDVEQVDEMLSLLEEDGLIVGGLMTIGFLTEDKNIIRETFSSLRNLREKLNSQLPVEKKLTHLSMGMSNDYEIAVEEGATMIRLGTAIFGPRACDYDLSRHSTQ